VQICFEKFALASAIDAFCRKQIEINEMKEKNKIAERILSISLIKMIRIQLFITICITEEITALKPDGFHSNGQVVHYRMYEEPEKAYEKRLCEFFESTFYDHQKF
jgi:hypothetical protein